jgi:hypothetical protein
MNKLLHDYRKSAENRVMIYTDPLSSYGYNSLLVNFKHHFPEIQTEVVELVSESLDDFVKAQKDAVGIKFSTNQKARPGTKSHTIVSDRLAAFVGQSHRLVGSGDIELSEFKDEMLQIISYRQSQFLNGFTLEQFRKAGFVPNVAPFDLWYNTARETIRDLDVPAVFPEMVAKIFCEQDTRVIGINADSFYITVVISDECTHSAALRFFEFASSYEAA